ncbi:MAG: phosphoribosylamine--glycine ligase, partial [Nitrospirota bacterium]|nr:phosphoribosylamine--glycine ligase [Nitrospirota bacterium]
SAGYPGSYPTGLPITGLPEQPTESVLVFHAGTTQSEQAVLTNGGRVLGVTALADTIQNAQQQAYAALAPIQFQGCYYRSDIAHRVL